ncbi:MAG: hypothetical protein AB1512_10755 [Thermodesulfobacteriota bacterium]
MGNSRRKGIHVLEFECEHPLRFYGRCSACARFGEGCADLSVGAELLRGKRRLVYNADEAEREGVVYAGAFNCTAPLRYFEATRKACGHEGKCREEGLLIALLSGKKGLEHGHKEIAGLPVRDRTQRKAAAGKGVAKAG